MITNRIKNTQNVQNAHLSSILHLTTLSDTVTSDSIKEHTMSIENNMSTLKNAIETQNVILVNKTLIHIIEEISLWIEKIEYRVYLNRQNSSEGPSKEKVDEHNKLLNELDQIVTTADSLSKYFKESDNTIDSTEKIQIQNCLTNLRKQINAVSNVTKKNGSELHNDMSRWNDFIILIESINTKITELRNQYEALQFDDDSPINILIEQLNDLDDKIATQLNEISIATQTARGLMRDFPSHSVPIDVYELYENARNIEDSVALEKNRLLQLKDLSEEYEQTLKQFGQIIRLTQSLVDQPIQASSFDDLQQEMQKHRKCFVNLSHCRMILQSLEQNIDSESRKQHLNMHQSLIDKAAEILDKASERAQHIALAASRWTVLENGLVEEIQWLHLAQQRVPDLSEVSTVDHERIITLYKSIFTDINQHHARIIHFTNLALQLQDLVSAPKLQEEANDCLAQHLRLHEDISIILRRLSMFGESWSTYETLTDRLEQWMLQTDRELTHINIPTDLQTEPNENTRIFWEIRVHYGVYNKIRKQITNSLEHSIEILPIRDELLQRQFHQQLEERWANLTKKIESIQNTIVNSLSDVPTEEKLDVVRKELNEIQMLMTSAKTVIKNEDELNVYIERMQVLNNRLGKNFQYISFQSFFLKH